MIYLPIMNAIGLHDIEQTLLPYPSFLLKEIMFRVCSSYVTPRNFNQVNCVHFFVVFTPDNFLTCTLGSEKCWIFSLVLGLMSATEDLPSHSAEMMRNPLPDQLLQLQTLRLGRLQVIGSWLVDPPLHLDVARLPPVPVLEDVAPCQPEVALSPAASLSFSALLTAPCIKSWWQLWTVHIRTWLHRDLRRDARGSGVTRSWLRLSARHTETAQRLGVTFNQSDTKITPFITTNKTLNLLASSSFLSSSSSAMVSSSVSDSWLQLISTEVSETVLDLLLPWHSWSESSSFEVTEVVSSLLSSCCCSSLLKIYFFCF